MRASTLYIRGFTHYTSSVIQANVTLGELSKRCRGLGICSITLDPPLTEWETLRFVQVCIRLTEDQKLNFLFEKKMLKRIVINRFFREDYFTVGESIDLPEEILGLLNLPGYTIYAGEYIITQEAGFFSIIF